MYKITIDLSAWGTEDEVMTIETFDFDKIEIIKDFIDFQKDHGWAVDYDVVEAFDEEDDEEEESEDEDEDAYFYDPESDAWYWYDEENDEWVELESEEDEEAEEVEQTSGATYVFNITTADKE